METVTHAQSEKYDKKFSLFVNVVSMVHSMQCKILYRIKQTLLLFYNNSMQATLSPQIAYFKNACKYADYVCVCQLHCSPFDNL